MGVLVNALNARDRFVTPGNPLIGDGGKAIAAFAHRAGFPFLG